MILEELEYDDWRIVPNMSEEQRKEQSIETYYLNNWYEHVRDITFNTYIYASLDDVPDVLPFEKCIVRHENKSPKDSEFWGPIGTKTEMINIFNTSLRCKTFPGNYYCVREYKKIGTEYRCFWNNGLMAISADINYEPNCEEIINYINKIKSYIPYHRCVFDIAEIESESTDVIDKYIFIEFNSWESNSRNIHYDWISDTEILYNDKCYTDAYNYDYNGTMYKYVKLYNNFNVHIRWNGGSTILKTQNDHIHVIEKFNEVISFDTFFTDYEIIKNLNYSNTIITSNYIYCTNDIWMGQFDINTFVPLNWKRDVYRFGKIELCKDGSIVSNGKYYYYDLTPKIVSSNILKNNYEPSDIKYGFEIKNKKTGEEGYMRMLSNCSFMIQFADVKYYVC